MLIIISFLLTVICLSVLVCSLLAGAVRKIRGKEQKKNFRRTVLGSIVLSIVFFFVGCTSVIHSVLSDGDESGWRTGIFGERHADEKTADKMADNFLNYLKTAQISDDYYISISSTLGYNDDDKYEDGKKPRHVWWQGDKIYAWKNFAHKIYKVDELWEHTDKAPYKHTEGFWYEKDGKFYGTEHIKDYPDRNNEDNDNKAIFRDKDFVKEISWENLPCDEENKKARKILSYFIENYARMKSEGLFEAGFKNIPMLVSRTGNSYRLEVRASDKYWDDGDKNGPEEFSRIKIQDVVTFTNSSASSFLDGIMLSYVDSEREWYIKTSWNNPDAVIGSERKILKWESDRKIKEVDWDSLETDSDFLKKIESEHGKFPFYMEESK